MDSIGIAAAALGANQQLIQQNLLISVLKTAAEEQNQIVNLLAASAGQSLQTSGLVGTNINTTA
jgi:hypothetical protein